MKRPVLKFKRCPKCSGSLLVRKATTVKCLLCGEEWEKKEGSNGNKK